MKLLSLLVTLLALGLSVPATAQAPNLQEGKHFTRLNMPQPTEAAGKVEVIEFFAYTCPHCADFEPKLKSWLKKLPADVHFRKVPAIFQANWAPGARLYYTLEALGLLEKHSDEVFTAMIRQRINLTDEKTLLDWIGKQGIDRQQFANMYKSFAIDSKVRMAAEMTQEYGFGGVPAIVLRGTYMPGPRLSSQEEMLAVTSALIAKNRAELKK